MFSPIKTPACICSIIITLIDNSIRATLTGTHLEPHDRCFQMRRGGKRWFGEAIQVWRLSTQCETSGPGVNWIRVHHTGACHWTWRWSGHCFDVNYGSAQCPRPSRISRALWHCLQQLSMAQTTSAFLPPGSTTADPSSGADQSTLPQPGDDLQLGACSTATAVANVAFPSDPYICF